MNWCTGEFDKTDRTDLGKCIHLCDETQGNDETPALSTQNCLLCQWYIYSRESLSCTEFFVGLGASGEIETEV